eukprot:GABV01000104.1.p1 GENE.GABV01000104.1~~GABV01000104.1.p1  ORF type:complete len:489 (-),score=139.46 GABV01000104.1:211-1677(-)
MSNFLISSPTEYLSPIGSQAIASWPSPPVDSQPQANAVPSDTRPLKRRRIDASLNTPFATAAPNAHEIAWSVHPPCTISAMTTGACPLMDLAFDNDPFPLPASPLSPCTDFLPISTSFPALIPPIRPNAHALTTGFHAESATWRRFLDVAQLDPIDLARSIFQFLQVDEIAITASVSRSWQRLATDSILIVQITRQRFAFLENPQFLESALPNQFMKQLSLMKRLHLAQLRSMLFGIPLETHQTSQTANKDAQDSAAAAPAAPLSASVCTRTSHRIILVPTGVRRNGEPLRLRCDFCGDVIQTGHFRTLVPNQPVTECIRQLLVENQQDQANSNPATPAGEPTAVLAAAGNLPASVRQSLKKISPHAVRWDHATCCLRRTTQYLRRPVHALKFAFQSRLPGGDESQWRIAWWILNGCRDGGPVVPPECLGVEELPLVPRAGCWLAKLAAWKADKRRRALESALDRQGRGNKRRLEENDRGFAWELMEF